MLCSPHSHYIDAIKGLSALYITHGYLSNGVVNWTQSNISQHWQNRLRNNRHEHGDVLVLKSEFNTALNYFSAKELGDTILGYWHGWLATVESGAYNIRYPAFSRDLGDLEDVEVAQCVIVNTPSGPSPILDIQILGLANRKLIVSRKHTRNLFDLTSLWKKTVINRLERDVLEPEENLVEASDSSSSDESETDLSYLFHVINYR